METELLYHNNSYMQEFEANVIEVKDKLIILDKTAFYYGAGGQPCDTGILTNDDEEYRVVSVIEFEGKVAHEVDREGIKKGDKIKGKIDWEKRYILMRYHTAAHLLSKVIFNETEALISGNQLGLEGSRIDFALENFNREDVNKWFEITNKLIEQKIPIKIEHIEREEALKIENFVRTKADLLQKIDLLRVVNIEGFDKQACGGTHLKNTEEIKEIILVKIDNKGKNNRRIYFKLKD